MGNATQIYIYLSIDRDPSSLFSLTHFTIFFLFFFIFYRYFLHFLRYHILNTTHPLIKDLIYKWVSTLFKNDNFNLIKKYT